jgi:hypothetical protein
MNRHRPRRSVAIVTRAPRNRPARASSHAVHVDRADRRQPAIAAEDVAALAFLSDILVGEATWSLAEVRRLISIRESAARGC